MMIESELNYRFASGQGVLWSQGNLYYRQSTSANALAEAQRVLAQIGEVTSLTNEEFDERLQHFFKGQAQGLATIVDDISEQVDLSELAKKIPDATDLAEIGDDAPIVELINKMLIQAIRGRASDIHLEPQTGGLAVRFRQDGILALQATLPIELAPLVVSRVKVMAKLDIGETRLPQDGRFTREMAGRPVDVRVAMIPSGAGERVVMRLLDRESGRLQLLSLGMPKALQDAIQQLILRPSGILLTTGPTNSGKTTTLYGALQEINDHNLNIMTIEDPIEYELPGISQTAVNSKSGMSFEKGLRAILRQDPDVIMVGEIRDLETARTAIHASQTGHLVLSTLHTNSAVGALVRLRDMGVEPYLLASSIIGVLAQRLVRALCSVCKQPVANHEIGFEQEQMACGCKECEYTGYQGRVGIYELLEVTPAIKQLVHDNASEQKVLQLARKRQHGLYDNGMHIVAKGITTREEVNRVCIGSESG